MTTKEYIAAQNEWLKDNRIHDGDEVKVFRSAEDYEDGWGDGWADEMSDCVGLIGTVHINIEYTENGIKLSFDTFHDSWNFPYFVLDPTLKQGVVKPVTDDAVIHLLAKWLSRYPDCPYGDDHECEFKRVGECRDLRKAHPECWIRTAKEALLRGEENAYSD